jgi:DNA-binding transcriptional regulator YdaS (Cro superfamily)
VGPNARNLVDGEQEILSPEHMENNGDTGMAALAQAVRLLGSQIKTGKAIGVSGQAVSEVLRRGRRVPAEWCLKLQKATGGAVTANALRPDLYPKETDDCGGGDDRNTG